MFITKLEMNGKRLTNDFYSLDTIDVARELLGKVLVHQPPGHEPLAGLIVETEAYLGFDDPAAHSFGGRRTPRTEVMFGSPGLSYIYFIYGVYFCFNVVTAPEGVPEAVLVRALSPIAGIDHMRRRRPVENDFDLANGPGKLCVALGLGRAQNGLDLCSNSTLWIEDRNHRVRPDEIVEGPRIGIGLEADHVFWPLRFGVRGHNALSSPRFPPP